MMRKRPEWTDEAREDDFAASIMAGQKSSHDGFARKPRRKFRKPDSQEPSVQHIAEGILTGNRVMLSKAITLIESNASRHFERAQEVLKELLPHAGNSIRIGITGVPGAGKSTFIEAFGGMLCDMGHRVAVLAVDPSSSLTGGSILGDKTRMEKLSRHPNAYIRPSPSEGTLGGVHRKTRETVIACEAAGYDIILVETVGVGQSEVMVRDMVDFFLMLTITGAGDELQGMKKGIMELVDAIVVNKADGDNIPLARKTKREYNQILHFLAPATPGWTPKAHTCSSLHGTGIEDLWSVVKKFKEETQSAGVFRERRSRQSKEWLFSMIREKLEHSFFRHHGVRELKPAIEQEVISGSLPVAQAVERLFDVYRSTKNE